MNLVEYWFEEFPFWAVANISSQFEWVSQSAKVYFQSRFPYVFFSVLETNLNVKEVYKYTHQLNIKTPFWALKLPLWELPLLADFRETSLVVRDQIFSPLNSEVVKSIERTRRWLNNKVCGQFCWLGWRGRWRKSRGRREGVAGRGEKGLNGKRMFIFASTREDKLINKGKAARGPQSSLFGKTFSILILLSPIRSVDGYFYPQILCFKLASKEIYK